LIGGINGYNYERRHCFWRIFLKNKNVDIKFSAHDAFLEWPWSSTSKTKNIWKPNNFKNWGDLRCSGKISNFCSISGNRRVNVRRSLNTSTIYFFRNQQQRWNHHAKYISTREYCFLGHVIFCQHHDHHMFLRNLLFFLMLKY
jgi:hypothetical protein